MATSGSCSIRLRIIFPAKSLRSAKAAGSAALSARVMLSMKTGMSVALAFITLGRSRSRGRRFIAASIFSLTSMNARSMSLPKANFILIMALPLRDSDRMSSTPSTCIRLLRRTLTTLLSISRELMSGRETATVISGISMSGISDTGSLPEAAMPRTITARKLIITATGRCTRNLTMVNGFFRFIRVLRLCAARIARKTFRAGAVSVTGRAFSSRE